MSLETYSLVLGSLSVIIFGSIAAYIGHTKYHIAQSIPLTAPTFITARNSLGPLVIAWSIYSNAVGAVTAFFPPSYAASDGVGLVGALANVASNMIPPFFIFYFGGRIREKYPDVLSLSHFMLLRYGRTVQIVVGVIVLFNMGMALVIEYTAIASIYKNLVGSDYSLFICLLIALVTSAYTAYGGLYASLATDQWQGIASSSLIVVICVYTAFFAKLDLGEFPASLYPDERGYSSLFVLPVSVITGTLLSEASFQRAWAAHDSKSLKLGAIIGSLLIGVVIFIFSMGGIIAVWSGRVVTDSNNVIFALVGPPYAPIHVTLIVVLITTILSTSAIDSLQNGLLSTLTSNFLIDQKVIYSRIVIITVNLTCLAIGWMGVDIVTAFAITNVITCLGSVFLTGVYMNISGRACLFGFFVGFLNVCVFGVFVKGDFVEGMLWIWIEERYNYPPFLVALSSFLYMAGWEMCARLGSRPVVPVTAKERGVVVI